MGLPKRTNTISPESVNLFNGEYPYEPMRSGASELLKSLVMQDNTFFPKPLSIQHIDEAVYDHFSEELSNNNIVPSKESTIFTLGINRISEFKKSWSSVTKERKLLFPLAIITRELGVDYNTDEVGYNIPTGRLYPVHQEITNDGNKKIIDTYYIAQPIPVTLSYTMYYYCKQEEELNNINTFILNQFQSRQRYIFANGYYIPVHFEGVSDSTDFNDMDKFRYIEISFEMRVTAYLIDETKFDKKTSFMIANINSK